MRLCVADPDGELHVRAGPRAAGRSGHRVVALHDAEVIPLPEGTTLAHLPGRRALGIDRQGRVGEIDGRMVPVAAILPVGYLRTLLPASRPEPAAARLPLFGYTAVAERDGEMVVAAHSTDAYEWWHPRFHRPSSLPPAIAAAERALPGNRLVPHLARCATEFRCYTA